MSTVGRLPSAIQTILLWPSEDRGQIKKLGVVEGGCPILASGGHDRS